MAKQKTRKIPTIETVNIGAAAVDIGSREHMAAVNPEVADSPVRAFSSEERRGGKGVRLRWAAFH